MSEKRIDNLLIDNLLIEEVNFAVGFLEVQYR